jgi:DNA topoisomerase III
MLKAIRSRPKGKVLVEPGWLAIYGREAVEGEGSLPKIEPAERVRTAEVDAVA